MRKLLIVFTALTLLVLVSGVVGAQDTPTAPVPSFEVGRPNPIRSVLAIIAEETGLKERAILREVMSGRSLADIIQENGGEVQAVIDQSVSEITAQVNQAVTNGKMTQERADRVLENLPDVITQAINGELFPSRQNGGRGQQAVVGLEVLRMASDETGLTVREIAQEIRSGKSLADVLTAHNVDVSMFITQAVEGAKTRLDRAVNKGRLTQADADTRLAQFEQRLNERIYQVGGMDALSEATAAA